MPIIMLIGMIIASGALVSTVNAQPANGKTPRADALGDPLPPGAVRALGLCACEFPSATPPALRFRPTEMHSFCG